ncbi:hypothetical protein SALBM217S_08003 [Streptomyces griseoloalbus]|uniref:Poly(3-hydroxyalkanoate) polymerase subunit PhaE n=1 Tax=Streptomyces pseudogriseolus TaxID=36817 RepID=A0ABQ2SQ62_STREZ|nr:hypothetical protein [Streptomyces rubiginosus]GGS33411.1 hypothetical protein GCM10010285_10270 [Streptomyces rubiginosus]
MSTYWGHGGLYETWVDFLRRWSAEETLDPGALPRLAQEDFPGETWERLVLHLGEALDSRLTAWAERLTEALLAAPDEFSAGRELAQARAGLRTVRAMAGHPGLPESLRTRFTELVDGQITDLQQQLERRLDHLAAANGSDPRWVEQRRRTLRDNALTETLTPSVAGPADPWARTHAADRPRRRVITD